ncbi:hypothetical protein [Candidatus Magnetobacterium casense]|uniref:Uncharacterized protein n=1 Tax=Candidatus Magnetobacterium casense TaxID=1455061 RepID=A0ABS6RVQ8_9BACT|nr:hypothetical protein [Candidatus Magnetobacterium casensis]MBV6340358.1 hypothetical protein [Candidatus Magnetobacterium casensis]
MANIQADPSFNKQQIEDMKEAIVEEIQSMVNLSTAGAHAAIAATAVQAVFVAPRKCTITSMKMGVTTSVSAHADNHWTIQVVNQTGDLDLLSSAFSTDSDVATTSNGSRAFTADTMLSIHNNGTNEFLQNNNLAEGDILILTATKAASAANLTYPVMTIRYKVTD